MKLLKITTLLITVLSLTHCDVDISNVKEELGCKNLNGSYSATADLRFNLIPSNQNYNVSIAAVNKDVIIQIESAEEDKNDMLCALFYSVKVQERMIGIKSMSGYAGVDIRVSDDNVGSFAKEIVFFKYGDLVRGEKNSCAVRSVNVSGGGRHSKMNLTSDRERGEKSFEAIKKECSLLIKSAKSVEVPQSVTKEEFAGPIA